MNLEKQTFGKTPAAIYLVDRLNQLDSSVILKRTGKTLTGWRNTFSELEKANNNGILSAHNLARVISSMREGFKVDVGNELISNLVTNILVGEMKVLLRKSCDIRKIESYQKRIVGNKQEKEGLISNNKGYKVANIKEENIELYRYTVSDVKEEITPNTLTEKWKVKMIKRNIVIK